MTSEAHAVSQLFVEIGTAIILLAILARIANRWGFSAIPLYLLAGLVLSKRGVVPIPLSQGFIEAGAEIGVLMLLFMLGLECSGEELKSNLRSGLPAGMVDFVLNFTPGLVAGLILRWQPLAAVLLGGITYVSSSGVVAKVLQELRRTNHPETPTVLTVLILEDLAMAVYLPLVGVLLLGGTPAKMAISVAVAVAVVLLVLVVALRYGQQLSRLAAHESDEIVVLTSFGAVLLVAGLAERFQVSAAIGAFLVGIALSGPLAEKTHRLLAPLRDLFAATFFFFFGLEIDASALSKVLPFAVGLGVVTAATKIITGYWASKRAGVDRSGALRAGTALVARGEFSMVIAGLGLVLQPNIGPLAAAYVLFLAVLGPILARLAK
jgi:CPA2 family monovalent cation:H+ antiporter-2